MSRDAIGTVRFDEVTKRYRRGQERVNIHAAWPFGELPTRSAQLTALDCVTFDVEPGDTFALIGANGAGKSTALKCLAGVTQPNSGRVHRVGRVVALIELGAGFHPDLSGMENAKFAAALAGMRGKAARSLVEQAVDFSELEDFMSTPVKRYSSGMYARLSFGIAAALPADILLVDEILAVGDLRFQRKCYTYLQERRKERGVTLLFVSHNDWVLKDVCDRGVLLDHGRVVLDADIAELLRSYHAHLGSRTELDPEGSEGAVKVVSAELLSERMLPSHAALRLKATVDVAPGMAGRVGLALFDSVSRLVWATYSHEHALDLAPGRHTLTIDVADVSVLPGPCRLELFTFTAATPTIEDLRRLEVTVVGDSAPGVEHGVVDVRATWQLDDVGEAP
jgi:ABC-type polysaccharide/polyol phosphate transport system ATPase subunit